MGAALYAIGRMRFAPYRAAADEYLGRIRHYLPFQEVEFKSDPSSKLSAVQIQQKESAQILGAIAPSTYLCVLDERGKLFSSVEFAKHLGKLQSQALDMAFAIGGAYGHHETLRQRASLVFALSPLTFPHELARVLVYEQIYRAMTILKNEPYHK
ncbi:MAG: 23S rRNA (pseudouridine(1915)-N(3))-methyltransferase RlmH [Bradymonadia bacterium]